MLNTNEAKSFLKDKTKQQQLHKLNPLPENLDCYSTSCAAGFIIYNGTFFIYFI